MLLKQEIILKRKRRKHYLPDLLKENNFLKLKEAKDITKDRQVDKLDYIKITIKISDIKKKNDR